MILWNQIKVHILREFLLLYNGSLLSIFINTFHKMYNFFVNCILLTVFNILLCYYKLLHYLYIFLKQHYLKLSLNHLTHITVLFHYCCFWTSLKYDPIFPLYKHRPHIAFHNVVIYTPRYIKKSISHIFPKSFSARVILKLFFLCLGLLWWCIKVYIWRQMRWNLPLWQRKCC